MDIFPELNAFPNWAMLNRPSTGQIALYMTLLAIHNSLGRKEWFSVPNQTLSLMIGQSRQGLEKSRNGLIQKNLIEYKTGRANQAGVYRLIGIVDSQKVGTPVGTPVGTVVGTVVAHTQSKREREYREKIW